MQERFFWQTRGKVQTVVAAIGLLVIGQSALGAPVVQQISGTLNHKSTITIRGSGFGSKATAAPLVWDDASGSKLLDKWDGVWPTQLPGYNTGYYSPMRGIGLPHNHISHYIAGAHATNRGSDAGYNVAFWKNISLQPFPFDIYASWYQRADDHWVFGQDNNYKTFAYSVCCNPYEMPHNWYLCYGPPHPGSTTDTEQQWAIADDGESLMNPDVNGKNAWWSKAANPMGGKWAKVEVAIKVTNQTDGYVKVWEDGRLVVNYAGPTDKYAGNRRTIGIGGYARDETPQNWRYFADAYVDTTLSRVVLANNPVLSQATVIENQIPSKWSDASITATVNLGRFAQGQSAYLFVVDSTGAPNATGLAVKAGASSGLPNPPGGVSVK